MPVIPFFMGYQTPSPNLSPGGEGRTPFSLAGRRAGDEGVLSVKIVDPAIMLDFAIALTISEGPVLNCWISIIIMPLYLLVFSFQDVHLWQGMLLMSQNPIV
jgi:hypothetical protein